MSNVNPNEDSAPSQPSTTSGPVIAAPSSDGSTGALILAGIWAAVALVAGIALFVNAKSEAYGGDAYTGIQNAVVMATQGIAWLIIASGVLGLIIALSRVRR